MEEGGISIKTNAGVRQKVVEDKNRGRAEPQD